MPLFKSPLQLSSRSLLGTEGLCDFPMVFSRLKNLTYSTSLLLLHVERCSSTAHLHDLSLDSLQQNDVFPKLGTQQSRGAKSSSPAGHTALNASQDTFGFLGCEHILQVYAQPLKYQTAKSQSILHPVCTWWSSYGPTPPACYGPSGCHPLLPACHLHNSTGCHLKTFQECPQSSSVHVTDKDV